MCFSRNLGKGFEIPLTAPVSSSLQGTQNDHQKFWQLHLPGVYNVRQLRFLVCTFVLESSFAQSHHCCLSHKNSPLAPMHFSIHPQKEDFVTKIIDVHFPYCSHKALRSAVVSPIFSLLEANRASWQIQTSIPY